MGRAGACAFCFEGAERSHRARGASRDARTRPSGRAREGVGIHCQSARTAAVPRATEAGFNYRDGTFSALSTRVAYGISSALRPALLRKATHMCVCAGHTHTRIRGPALDVRGGGSWTDSSQDQLLATSVLQNVTEYPPYAITLVPARTVCTTSAGRRNWNRSKTFCEERWAWSQQAVDQPRMRGQQRKTGQVSGSEDGENGAVAKETCSPRLPSSPPPAAARIQNEDERSEEKAKGKKDAN